MNKGIKALVIAGILTSVLSTTVLAAPFTGPNIVNQDGKQIEYYMDYTDKVYNNLPRVIETSTTGDSGKTVKYAINDISNVDVSDAEHSIVKTGAYMSVSGVVRESSYTNERLLYAKGNVSVTFNGDSYLMVKEITKIDKNVVEGGQLIYSTSYDYRTKQESKTTVFRDLALNNRTFTFKAPGLYYINFSQALHPGMSLYVYVGEENESLTYTELKAETAVPTSVQVKVDSKSYTAPAYKINGDNYLRLRDVGYMVNGTSKQFNVVKSKLGLVSLLTGGGQSYQAVGGEMKAIATGNKTATPSTTKMNLNGSELNPSAYTIDGVDYIKVQHIAGIDDFGITSTGNTITINTSAVYTKVKTEVPVVKGQIKVSSIERLYGDNRYQTAVAISKSGWSQSDNVVLASGESYTDALVGSSFAYLKDAPMLITPSAKLDVSVSAEISRLKAKTVYILGNGTSVSKDVENELKQKYTVVRIGGTGVYDTAIKIGDEIRKTKQFDTVVLAAKGDFADALSIAPFSARNTMPIIFTDKDSVDYDTLTKLSDWGVKNVVIVGGTGVVAQRIEGDLSMFGIKTTRLAGPDRYDTALEIIKHFAPSDGYKNISIATGESYPDALTGALLAAKNNTPLVLVSKNSVKANVADYLSKLTIDKAYIFGGTGVVSDGMVSK